jgi:hypothetical protein
MRPNPNRGRVYRRCGCRDEHGRQLGSRCAQLANPRHGAWAFAVDMPSPNHRRKTMRRSGYNTRSEARAAFSPSAGMRTGRRLPRRHPDPRRLPDWLAGGQGTPPQAHHRRPLPRLPPQRPAAGLRSRPAGTPHPPTHRPVRAHPTGHPPRPSHPPPVHCHPVQRAERRHPAAPANPQRRPLHHHPTPPPYRPSMLDNRRSGRVSPLLPSDRRTAHRALRTPHQHRHTQGEALGLHWTDVDLKARLLFVRHNLVAVNNSRLVLSTPKTTGSRDWIALSARAVNALRRQARKQRAEALNGPAQNDQGLVFCRPDGQPLRPERVLRHFEKLTQAAGLSRIRVHDLRHLAAITMIASGVPLAMVSKTLRHSTVSTTVDIYGHLTRQAAQEAVDATATALSKAEHKAKKAMSGRCSRATILRPQNGLNRSPRICPTGHIHSAGYVGTAGFEPTTP